MEERYYVQRGTGMLVRGLAYETFRALVPTMVCHAEEAFDDLERISKDEFDRLAALRKGPPMTDIVERLRSPEFADVAAKYLMAEAAAEIERLRAAVAAEREACAKIVDDECQRVLAKITPADPASFGDTVNHNLRMTAVLLPSVAAAIRARGDTKDNQ